MTEIRSVELRGSTPGGASWLLGLSLCLSSLLLFSGGARADTDLVQSGQITINPSSGPVMLTLQGPAFDSASPANYGLVLSYHDSTSTEATATTVLRSFRPAGQYQWQFSTAAGDGRLAMKLDNDHSLTLFDPQDAANTIVLRPGTAGTSGIFWNGQALATVGSTVPLVANGLSVTPGGFVGIGTITPGQQLTITGNFLLPVSTNTAGIIYQNDANGYAAPILSTYTPVVAAAGAHFNTFVGRNAGNLTSSGDAAFNVGVGAGALPSLTTGYYNVAVGGNAAWQLRSGGWNVALGTFALTNSTDSNGEVAVGARALASVDHTQSDVAIGMDALTSMQTGAGNTAVGAGALGQTNQVNFWEGSSTALGVGSGAANTTGSYNTFVGANSGANNTTGSCNIVIGYWAELPAADASYSLNIGNLIYGTTLYERYTTVGTSGKIGIGTSAPAARLDVNGDTHVRGVLRVPAAGDIGMGDFTAGTNPVPQP
ncbi:MAG: hypothetical protein ABJF10_16315 [Chthoniobacter sp.]|uniref:hypothetical protein n=1 Tax=Chthoniobacter sp. TaxID=2510640 RepID=UPI0032ADE0F3